MLSRFSAQVISIGRFKWVSFGQVKAQKTKASLKALFAPFFLVNDFNNVV